MLPTAALGMEQQQRRVAPTPHHDAEEAEDTGQANNLLTEDGDYIPSDGVPVRVKHTYNTRAKITCALCACVVLIATIGAAVAQHMMARGEMAPYQPPQLLVPKMINNSTLVWLGNGCFWERQYAYVNIELNCDFSPKPTRDPCATPFHRTRQQVTSRTGYAGGVDNGKRACYHHSGDKKDGTLYEDQGHAEVVQVELDPEHVQWQLTALLKDYFASFTRKDNGMQRPDPMDKGAPYRSVIGIPGGVDGPLYNIVQAENVYGMELRAGKGSDDDVFNVVWVMDSEKFPFQRAEQYHQFHSNFFGPTYPDDYVYDLWHLHIELNTIPPTGCPEQKHW